MPPTAVKTVQDLLFWQYSKIIAESAGMGKRNYGFVMDRFKKLQRGEINWSTSIREYVREREEPNRCIYCGLRKNSHWSTFCRGPEGDRTSRATLFGSAGDVTPAREADVPTSGMGCKRKIICRG
jgi:hypothetical protein